MLRIRILPAYEFGGSIEGTDGRGLEQGGYSPARKIQREFLLKTKTVDCLLE